MLSRIFIGGTGRSGTSIVYKALGYHEAIHSFPNELRFLVDPDGLINLLDALTVNYSPVQAREALFRFERLMRVYLTVPQRAPYRRFDLANWLDGEYYWQRLNQFCSELVDVEFSGTAWQIEPEHEGRLVTWARQLQELRQQLQGEPTVPFKLDLPREQLKVAKYFPDRKQLLALIADFVEDLFLHTALENGKQTWCEKTPQNIFHLNFLWELFPKSVFLHIKRDPRGIVHSLTKQSWKRAPNDIQGACAYLQNMFDCWFDVKGKVNPEKHRYLELKIEDIAAAPRCELEKIASFCGLEGGFDSLPEITLERVNYWPTTMPEEHITLVNQLLGSYIERMGYEIGVA
jgi:hypothetical protein